MHVVRTIVTLTESITDTKDRRLSMSLIEFVPSGATKISKLSNIPCADVDFLTIYKLWISFEFVPNV